MSIVHVCRTVEQGGVRHGFAREWNPGSQLATVSLEGEDVIRSFKDRVPVPVLVAERDGRQDWVSATVCDFELEDRNYRVACGGETILNLGTELPEAISEGLAALGIRFGR